MGVTVLQRQLKAETALDQGSGAMRILQTFELWVRLFCLFFFKRKDKIKGQKYSCHISSSIQGFQTLNFLSVKKQKLSKNIHTDKSSAE